MVSAGRYAGSLELAISGEARSYYDMESHPSVVQYVANEASSSLGRRVSEAEVEKHLGLSYLEREPRAEKDETGGAIHKALGKAGREKGVLWNLRKDFVAQAPWQWVIAMLDAGYEYQGHKGIEKYIFGKLKEGAAKPVINYEQLYRENLG